MTHSYSTKITAGTKALNSPGAPDLCRQAKNRPHLVNTGGTAVVHQKTVNPAAIPATESARHTVAQPRIRCRATDRPGYLGRRRQYPYGPAGPLQDQSR